MNERIQLLAEQANKGLKNGHLNFEEGLMLYSEKFAELIVRECSRIADGWVDNDDNGKNYPSGIIKQHFGVEQ